MGAALCDQHCISVFQIFHCGNPSDSCIQKPLMSGHQNRKRCQRNGFRYIRRYLCKNLTIRDNNGRRFFEFLQSLPQFIFLDTDRCAFRLQNIPDNLLLRQDQTSLRCRLVYWNNKNSHISRMHQITHQHQFVFFCLADGCNLLF